MDFGGINLNNYKLIEEKYIDEVASNCKVYTHIKTGARVLTLENLSLIHI